MTSVERRLNPHLLCGALLAAGLVCLAPALTLHGADLSADPATVHVRLTVSQQVSDIARARLIEEANRIWRNAGIALVWSRTADSPAVLRVLVVPRGVPGGDVNRTALAELVGLGTGRAIALAAVDRAQQLVAASRGPAIVAAALHDDRVGLALGRAIAHEIGHYLLNTPRHAQTGLMRAAFEATDLTDRRSPGFELDAAAHDWLRDRVAVGLPLGPRASEFVAIVARR